MRHARAIFLLLLATAGACAGERSDALALVAASDTSMPVVAPPAGNWTDPAERAVQLAAFREGLAPPTALEGGAASAEALVHAFVRAVETRDSLAFAPMLLSRAEFAWLHYPAHPLGRPPYDLSPQEMWFQLVGNSAKGLRETLEKRGGRPLGFVGFRCDPPVDHGASRFHGGCAVRRRDAGGAVVEERLFGALLEREGRWKFVSYSARL